MSRTESSDTGAIMSAQPWLSVLLALGLVGAPLAASGEPPEDSYEHLEARVIAVSERVKPSVVHIQAIVKVNDRRSPVTGSGVIASSDGKILTNHHVVDKAEKVEVTVPGRKRKYTAEIIGTDKQTDIALLRIQPEEPLPAADFGSAESLRVGQWVLAIGNPYGLDGTVSMGIVSAKGRNLNIPDLINDFIQTDAMIDRGSSGGPLVDLDGKVVGVNSRGQGRGIGFTIPIETVLDVVKQIEQGGVERGWLGITMQPLDRDLAAYFSVPDATGVVVNSVATGSPADRSGLRPGDIIERFAGSQVAAEKDEDLGSFQRLVARLGPQETVELAVLRDGKRKQIEVTLAKQPKVQPDEAETELGFHVQEITENLHREHRLSTREGAFVSFVARGSTAAEAGLTPGDVIQQIEKRRVEDLSSLRRAVRDVEDERTFLITARRGEETKFLLVKRGRKQPPADVLEDDPGEASLDPGNQDPDGL